MPPQIPEDRLPLCAGRLYIAESPGKGRGVFSTESLFAGEMIEVCPIIPLGPNDAAALKGTALYDYYFCWGQSAEQAAIALGYGSVYNHDWSPNAAYDMYFDERVIVIYALRDIPAGEEICLNYNGDPDDKSPLWFESLP